MRTSSSPVATPYRLLAERIQRFLDHTELVTRWQFDHVDRAIDALHDEDFAEGGNFMLWAEEPHLLRAPTDFDGGNGCATALRERLSNVLVKAAGARSV